MDARERDVRHPLTPGYGAARTPEEPALRAIRGRPRGSRVVENEAMSSLPAAASPLDRDDPRGLTHALVEQLKAQILDGRLRPGDQVPTEAALTETYGVSRTVVREAIARLRAAGLVDSQQGRGSFVLDVPTATATGAAPFPVPRTHADVVDLIELRIGVESEAAALAATRRTAHQLAALTRAYDALARTAQSPGGTVEADFAFHLAIAQASGNRYVVALLTALGPAMILLHRAHLDDGSDITDAPHFAVVLGEHATVLRAIEAQDPATAAAAMRLHLAASRARLRRA